jgi:hypothetical protein
MPTGPDRVSLGWTTSVDSRSHLLWRREARRSPRVHRWLLFGWHQGGHDLVEGPGGFLQKSKLLQLPGGVVVSGHLFEKMMQTKLAPLILIAWPKANRCRDTLPITINISA